MEVNARPHLQGRVQFSSGKQQLQTLSNTGSDGNVAVSSQPVYFVTIEWNEQANPQTRPSTDPPSYDFK